jgi:hypothetical protein
MADFEDDEIVGYSHEAARNGPGQNGDSSASSDEPGQHTTSGFLPQTVLPARVSDVQDTLAHRVSMDASGKPVQYPSTFGRSLYRAGSDGTISKSLNYPDKK